MRAARETGKVPQFAIGEFVLITAAVPRSKLRVRWLGPMRVVCTVNEWVYVLEDVVSGKHRTVHVQRMKLYVDADFLVTEDVRNQAVYDDVTHIEDIIDWRENGNLALRVRCCVLRRWRTRGNRSRGCMRTRSYWWNAIYSVFSMSATWRLHYWRRGAVHSRIRTR